MAISVQRPSLRTSNNYSAFIALIFIKCSVNHVAAAWHILVGLRLPAKSPVERSNNFANLAPRQ